MKNKKGFTLIEIMAVVVILGIIMLIAVPSVSSYILDSRKSAYATSIDAYVKSIEADFLQEMYGDYPDDDEILVVPIDETTLEKNNTKTSPFGSFIMEYCYVVIVPRSINNEFGSNVFDYYAYILDDAGYGLNNVIRSDLKASNVNVIGSTPFMSYPELVGGAILEYNGINYEFVDDRGNAIVMETV